MLTHMSQDTYSKATAELHRRAGTNRSNSFKIAAENAERKHENLTKVEMEKLRCSPSMLDTMQVCDKLPFGAAPPQLWFGIGPVGLSIPCVGDTCHSFGRLRENNLHFLILVLVWTVAFFITKKCFDMRLAGLRREVEEADDYG